MSAAAYQDGTVKLGGVLRLDLTHRLMKGSFEIGPKRCHSLIFPRQIHYSPVPNYGHFNGQPVLVLNTKTGPIQKIFGFGLGRVHFACNLQK